MRNAFFALTTAAIFTAAVRTASFADENPLHAIQTELVHIAFERGLRDSADDVLAIYPRVLSDLEGLLGLRLQKVPTVVLLMNRRRFLASADHPLSVAYALPHEYRIFMDVSKMKAHPFQLDSTLRHELCHLVLQNGFNFIPRFMEEGICQWAGGGLDEMLPGSRQDILSQAAITGRLIPFQRLVHRFPESDSPRILAYAQSKSFMSFLFQRYSRDDIFDLIGAISLGASMDDAFASILSRRFDHLESEWRDTLGTIPLWLLYASNHLYEGLFFLMAVITFIGFLRTRGRKKRLPDDDDVDTPSFRHTDSN